MINLEWFRTFKTIYETGTLTAAANKLFMSQPGVSLHLNSLEAHIGSLLFDRGSRKMVPTEQGKILYNAVDELINKLEIVEKYFSKKCMNERKTINIGMCFELFQHVLEPSVSTLEFNLVTKFGDYPDMLSDLDKGLLDFVITPQKIDMPNISYTPFAQETILLVAGQQSNTESFKTLVEQNNFEGMEKWLHQQKWFSTSGDMEHQRHFWQQNFSKRSDISFNFIVPNLTSIIRCISGQEGFAIVPDYLCKEALASNTIKEVWKGKIDLINTFYFAQRNKTIYQNELDVLKKIFNEVMIN